jgi:hypothetical protein
MKPIQLCLLALLACAIADDARAQASQSGVTRAQAQEELKDLEDLGYYPTRASSLRFPYDIEAAEARLAEQRRMKESARAGQNDKQ